MDKSLNSYVTVYKEALRQGDIRIAYEALRKYMLILRTHFSNQLSNEYSFGNVSPGYMDYTYFYFSDEYLQSKKLRFGVVLNHFEMRFELWLMGQNAKVQREYWELLKGTKWNTGRTVMPKYAFLEAVILDNPNFDNLDSLTENIEKKTLCMAKEIMEYLESKD